MTSAGPVPQPRAHVIDMPSVWAIGRQAATTVLFASLLPVGVFYATMSLWGLRPAVAVATVPATGCTK